MEAAIFLSQLLHQCYKEFEGSEGTVISKPMAETDVKKDKESGGGNTLLYTIFHCEICGTFLEFVTFSSSLWWKKFDGETQIFEVID